MNVDSGNGKHKFTVKGQFIFSVFYQCCQFMRLIIVGYCFIVPITKTFFILLHDLQAYNKGNE